MDGVFWDAQPQQAASLISRMKKNSAESAENALQMGPLIILVIILFLFVCFNTIP